MKSNQKQTMQLIGIALLVAAGVLIYMALSQPRVYEVISSNTVTVLTEESGSVSEEQTTAAQSESTAQAQSTVQSQTAAQAQTTAPPETTTEAATKTTVAVSVEVQTEQTTETTTQLQVTYPINLNTATLEELMTIDGLGEKRASAILEYRDYLGSYTSVEQIMNIQGFSEGIYAQVAGYLTV